MYVKLPEGNVINIIENTSSLAFPPFCPTFCLLVQQGADGNGGGTAAGEELTHGLAFCGELGQLFWVKIHWSPSW